MYTQHTDKTLPFYFKKKNKFYIQQNHLILSHISTANFEAAEKFVSCSKTNLRGYTKHNHKASEKKNMTNIN